MTASMCDMWRGWEGKERENETSGILWEGAGRSGETSETLVCPAMVETHGQASVETHGQSFLWKDSVAHCRAKG